MNKEESGNKVTSIADAASAVGGAEQGHTGPSGRAAAAGRHGPQGKARKLGETIHYEITLYSGVSIAQFFQVCTDLEVGETRGFLRFKELYADGPDRRVVTNMDFIAAEIPAEMLDDDVA